jgi:predicted CXXCH cytochrome family protein
MSNAREVFYKIALTSSLVLCALGCRRASQEPDRQAATTNVVATASSSPTSAPSASRQEVAQGDYVGSERCKACHAEAFAAWTGSQHQRAMQVPSAQTVLGDFEQRSFVFGGERSRFMRDGEKYRIETRGVTHVAGKRDAATRAFDVKYTFGVAPLQQYLLDTGDGFLQSLRVAYDTRPKSAGGGRWFQLEPAEHTQVGDELHWTAPAYNWNASCADCHSTALRKNYDAASVRYDTTFSEVSVGCEACHGPGARHVAQATESKLDAERGLLRPVSKHTARRWERRPGAHIASLVSQPPGPSSEVEACAACHSRRADLGGSAFGFDDRYRLSLLTEDLYFADGQPRQEVFELGAFLQSKMYAAGVICADCHEPHSAKLRRPGNALCTGCHESAHYDAPSHHLHAQGSAGSQCVECHMPTRTFMDIDPRREHRFAVPRPDLSVSLGVPNACTDQCHAERRKGRQPDVAAASWAADAIRERLGTVRPPSFAPALAAGRSMASDGKAALLGLIAEPRWPAIVRATALDELQAYPDVSLQELAAQAGDPSPLVRRSFAAALATRSQDERRARLLPMLGDPVRSVRLEATRGLLDIPHDKLQPAAAANLARAKMELRASLAENADRVGQLLDLARLELSNAADAADVAKVEPLYRRALSVEPTYAAAYVNYADYLRSVQREVEGIAILKDGLQKTRDAAPLEHALGLALIRTGDKLGAVDHLGKAHRLAPGSSRMGYVYAVALFDTGKQKEAIDVLEKIYRAQPGERSVLQLLAHYTKVAGPAARAEELARSLEAAQAPKL